MAAKIAGVKLPKIPGVEATPPAPSPTAADPASSSAPDPGHFTIGGKKISYDTLMLAAGGILGTLLLLRSGGSSSAATPSTPPAVPDPGTQSVMDTSALAGPPTASGATPAPGDFAATLYSSVLNRPADQSGLTYWDTQAATEGPAVAAAQFLATPEAQVQADYQRSLGRYADPSGLAYWTGQLQTGTMSVGQVQTAIAGSAEAKARAA